MSERGAKNQKSQYEYRSPKGTSLVITIHPELGFTSYMAIMTLQQIIEERISFPKEQINPENKIQLSKTFSYR